MRLATIKKYKKASLLSFFFSNLSIGVRRFGFGVRRLPTIQYSIARPNAVVPIVEEKRKEWVWMST